MRATRILLLVAASLCSAVLPRSGTTQTAQPAVGLELVAENFNAPVFLVAPGDGTGRRFIGEQMGLVYVLNVDGSQSATPFLDLRDQLVPLLKAFDERGLLALAFHPEFASNGLFYVNYSAKPRPQSPFKGKTAYTWRLSEFKLDAGNPHRADPASERVLLSLDWVNRKHNGGGLAFGPDGYLYVGIGDGGGVHGVPDVYVPPPPDSKDPARHAEQIPEDPFRLPARFHAFDRYAQDTKRLQGKILRIDVDGGHPGYAIPPTNLFRGKQEGRDEIFAWGFRNPFRLSFDRIGNGDLFVSGVAESFWETIYRVDRQGNYGWAIREGSHCFDRARMFEPPADCPRSGALGERIRDPIVEYANWSVKRAEARVAAQAMGTACVGGFVYRGRALPGLYGKLVVGDFSSRIEQPSGQLFVASPPSSSGALWPLEPLLQMDVRLHSLGEDADGELYLLTTALGMPVGNTGKVWKLVPGGR